MTMWCFLFHRRSHFRIGRKIDGRWHYNTWCDICVRADNGEKAREG